MIEYYVTWLGALAMLLVWWLDIAYYREASKRLQELRDEVRADLAKLREMEFRCATLPEPPQSVTETRGE